jgi:hypothetical protein
LTEAVPAGAPVVVSRDCIASEAERKNCGGGKALNHERMILSWLLKPKGVHAGQ